MDQMQGWVTPWTSLQFNTGSDRKTENDCISNCIRVYEKSRVSVSFHMHVFGVGEDAAGRVETGHGYKENIQTPERNV